MFGLEVQFDPEDLKLLSELNKVIAFCRPPSFDPEPDTDKWGRWLVWGSAAPKPLVRVFWEEKYRIFASDTGPSAYREIDLSGCVLTGADVCDSSLCYTLTEYYCIESHALKIAKGEKGTYYALNDSGRDGVFVGMAQAVDFVGNKKYAYLPTDAVPLANQDVAAFCPENALLIYLRRDDRNKRSRMAGVNSTPLYLSYKGLRENTVLRVRYNSKRGRFEQLL